MGLDKAIEHGKERRSQRSRYCDRPKGTCPYCIGSRTYKDRRQRIEAEDKLIEASLLIAICTDLRINDNMEG